MPRVLIFRKLSHSHNKPFIKRQYHTDNETKEVIGIFEQDYIMRQIKECVAAAMKLLFNKRIESPATLLIKDQQKQTVFDGLSDMIDDGRISEAISEMDQETQSKTIDDLLIGYNFYSYLCQKDDEFLKSCNIEYSDIKKEMKRFFSEYCSSEVIDLIMHEEP